MSKRVRPTDITPLPSDGWGRRRLPYPYFYDAWLVQPLDYDASPADGEIGGVCDVFTVALTPDENLKFSSALMIGAMIAYPTQWMMVWNHWESALNLANTYETGGCGSVSGDTFCDRVRDCINPDNGGFPEQDNFDEIPVQTDGNVCYSLGFAVDEIIEAGNIIIDLLEAANDAYDAYQDIAQRWLRYIPGVGDVVSLLDDLLAVGIPIARTVWNIQDTADTIKCALYCVITNNQDPPYSLTNDKLDAGLESAVDELPAVEGLVLELSDLFIPKRRIAMAFNYGVTDGGSDPFCGDECVPCAGAWRVDWTGAQLENLTIVDGGYDSRLQIVFARNVQGSDGDWATRAFIRWDPGNNITFTGAGMVGTLVKGRWQGGTNNMLSVDTPGYQHRFLEQGGVPFGGPGSYSYDEPSLTSRSAAEVEFTIRAARDGEPIPPGTQRGVGRVSSLTVYGEGSTPNNLAGGTLTLL